MSKLGAYIISGQIVGTGITKWTSSDLAGNTAFVCGDLLPTGYQDISSIVNWSLYGCETGKDYKYVRNEIKTLVFTIAGSNLSNWNLLSLQEKQIASQYFMVPKSPFRNEVYDTNTQIQQGKIFHSKSMESRQLRYVATVSELYNRLSISQADEIINDVVNNNLIYNYLHFGREGTVEGDSIFGLFDYIEARDVQGTKFLTKGLKAKNFIPDGLTMQQLIDKIIDILKYGNY